MMKSLARGAVRRPRLCQRQGGQATVEYAITSGIIIAILAVMGLLLTTFNDYGQRLLELIASDYP